jgi:hypothetical protein
LPNKQKPNNIMKFNKLIFFVLCCIVTLGACKKNPGITPVTSVDVYVAGSVLCNNGNNAAAYWKNGQLMAVLDSIGAGFGTGATGIALQGSDVYMAGENISPQSPVYWKNGVRISLNLNEYNGGGANCIALLGNDVYIGGSVYNNIAPYTHAAYWKNGVLDTLSGGFVINAVAVSGNDVYFAGQTSTLTYTGNGTYGWVAGYGAYWKNGGQAVIDTTNNATCIAVNGTDVYLGGESFIGGTINIGGSPPAVFSKNGKKTVLSNQGYVTGIAINGTDVFTSGLGYDINKSGNFAVYWKNNTVTQLNTGIGSTSAICLSGTDVYVSCTTFDTVSYKFSGYYWKNGTPVQLNSGGHASWGASCMFLALQAK